MSRRLGSRRNRQNSHQMPEVNLVPMMDVLMTVLTFFIVISMTFNAQRLAGINLPKTKGEGTESKQTKTPIQLVVGLDPQGKIRMGDRQLTQEALADRNRQVSDAASRWASDSQSRSRLKLQRCASVAENTARHWGRSGVFVDRASGLVKHRANLTWENLSK